MLSYNISLIELYPKGEGKLELSNNQIYKGLCEIKNNIKYSRDKMEPYFKKYESLFKSITSNFGSFKRARFHISSRFNTPSVTHLWITTYELINQFNLIPITIDDSWTHFSSENLPGSMILAVYHYINTMRNKDFEYKYNWIGSAPLNNTKFKSSDKYDLFKNYPDNWICNDLEIMNLVNIKYQKEFINLKDRFDGDISNPLYSLYIKKYVSNKVDLFTGNISVEIGKAYNLEEELNNKMFLGQLFLCVNILKKGGNAIFKNLTFFTIFNISMIAWIRNYFEYFIITKPASSKEDSSEIFLVCKNFKGINNEDLDNIYKILNGNFNYINGEIIKINKIKKKFWYEIGSASKIFIKQINNIESNIENFNKMIRYKNINTEYSRSRNQNANTILKKSQILYNDKAEKDVLEWGENNLIKPLAQKKWLNIINVTKRMYNKK